MGLEISLGPEGQVPPQNAVGPNVGPQGVLLTSSIFNPIRADGRPIDDGNKLADHLTS